MFVVLSPWRHPNSQRNSSFFILGSKTQPCWFLFSWWSPGLPIYQHSLNLVGSLLPVSPLAAFYLGGGGQLFCQVLWFEPGPKLVAMPSPWMHQCSKNPVKRQHSRSIADFIVPRWLKREKYLIKILAVHQRKFIFKVLQVRYFKKCPCQVSRWGQWCNTIEITQHQSQAKIFRGPDQPALFYSPWYKLITWCRLTGLHFDRSLTYKHSGSDNWEVI